MVIKQLQWNDENWLLLMQLYLRSPVGMKPKYSRAAVNLCLELHITPSSLADRMKKLDKMQTPLIERVWEKYAYDPHKLSRIVKKLREMKGFNHADMFYEGVEVSESFEKDFKPIAGCDVLTPMMLVIILDTYFRLTPVAMTSTTPEVVTLAKLMNIPADTVVEVMDAFQHCDPYLHREDVIFSPLLLPCRDIWNRYGNEPPEVLEKLAGELKEYFR